MKTIKEHLAAAERDRLLDCLSYRFIQDTLHLLELKDHTIQDIRDQYSRYMNAFIERLLCVEETRSEQRVFYLYTGYGKDEVADLIDLAEITEDIEAPGHDFSFTEWSDSLGYSVADTKLTQDYLIDLLAQYLEEASLFGTDEDSRAAKVSDLIKQLDEGMQSMKEGEGRPAEEVFEELRREHGFPAPEKDARQDELGGKVTEAIAEFELYSRTRERKRILAEAAKR